MVLLVDDSKSPKCMLFKEVGHTSETDFLRERTVDDNFSNKVSLLLYHLTRDRGLQEGPSLYVVKICVNEPVSFSAPDYSVDTPSY